MKKIKIFIASSEELDEERNMMAVLANSLNTALVPQGVQVIVVEWGNLDASMDCDHKQEEYRAKLRECEICMVLYWTTFGKYTERVLDVAYEEMKKGNKLQKLFVYFKDSDKEPTKELKEFRDSFPTKYGQCFTQYQNVDTLKAHFLLQFFGYQSQVLQDSKILELKDGKVLIDGKEYVSLQNVPFAGNNEKYNRLKEEILDIEYDLEVMNPDSDRYKKKTEKLTKLQDELKSMENGLWDTALDIARFSSQKCSECLQRAIGDFNQGNSTAAEALLKEEEIFIDAQRNISLIKLGEEGRKNLLVNIDELLLKVKLLRQSMNSSRKEINLAYKKTSTILTKIIEYASIVYGENSAEVLKYCRCAKMWLYSQPKRLIPFMERALKIAKLIYADDVDKIVRIYKDFANIYIEMEDYETAMQYQTTIVDLHRQKYGEESEQYLDAMIDCAYRNSDPSLARVWIEKALSHCQSINNIDKERELLEDVLGNIKIILFRARKADFEWVETIINRLKELSPQYDLLSTYILIAESYGTINRYTVAIEYYKEALELASEQNNGAAKRLIFIRLSRLYSGNRLADADKQIEYLNQALEIESVTRDWELYYELTNAYGHKGDYQAALENAKKSLDVAMNEVGAQSRIRNIRNSYRNLCKVYIALKDWNCAIETQLKQIEFEKQIEGSMIQSYENLARLYNRTNKMDEALKVYSYLLENNEFVQGYRTKASILQSMGWSCRLLEDLPRAEKYYKDAVALYLEEQLDKQWARRRDIEIRDSKIAEIYGELAWFYLSTEQYTKAQEALDQSYASCSKSTSPKLCARSFWQGVVYRGNGEYQKAIGIFESENKAFKKEDRHIEIALTQLEWGKSSEALDIALKVVEKHPDYARAYEVLGRIYQALGDAEKARAEFEKALDLMKEDFPQCAINRIKGLLDQLDVADKEKSDKCAEGAVDDTKPKLSKPDFTVKIAKFKPDLLKRKRDAWGVEITAGDEIIQIYFGGTVPSMIYLCTLLKAKIGLPLSREVFKHRLPNRNSHTPRHNDVVWLNEVYNVFYRGANTDFDQWYKKFDHINSDNNRNSRADVIGQGKCAANRVIKENLKKLPEIYDYCVLHSDQTNQETLYSINIPAEIIELPQELEELIGPVKL